MAAAIKNAYGVDSKLIAGGGGIFDVKANGTLVFSKHELGRFPEDAEILDSLKSLSG